ncbi:uncharacterized protein SOCEGT47_065730 [Sorangium cellulosum]|uniref:Uncharacterized protein n=1 Tax=Sorangium cellulosum TaxID=56 RepID=A0A4P2Q906_SORCE|nr:hypothetical protein [Sorangium cellulosum]AUX26020.1 uncharacterized protein SOCEGT47_065730 [Sorangium cellulosum]
MSYRKVTLVLVPSVVTAEGDGQVVRSHNGIIDIEGPFGSVHKVRLARGANQVTGENVVAASGTSPPKLELDTNATSASGRQTPPATASRAAPRTASSAVRKLPPAASAEGGGPEAP